LLKIIKNNVVDNQNFERAETYFIQMIDKKLINREIF